MTLMTFVFSNSCRHCQCKKEHTPSYGNICFMWNHHSRKWFECRSEKIMACKKKPVSFEAVVRCYLYAQNIFIFVCILWYGMNTLNATLKIYKINSRWNNLKCQLDATSWHFKLFHEEDARSNNPFILDSDSNAVLVS